MEYIAIAKNLRISPRKLRLVADSVKRNKLKNALAALSTLNKRAASPIKKVIDSAIANATNNFKVNREILEIKDIIVTEGTALKRYHFAARGRTRPYKRRGSHVRVILTDNVKQEARIKIQGEEEKASSNQRLASSSKSKTER